MTHPPTSNAQHLPASDHLGSRYAWLHHTDEKLGAQRCEIRSPESQGLCMECRDWNGVCLSTSLSFPTAHPSTRTGYSPPSSRLWHLLRFYLPQRPEPLLQFSSGPKNWPVPGFRDCLMEVLGTAFPGQEQLSMASGEPSEAPESPDTFPAQHDRQRSMCGAALPARLCPRPSRLPPGPGCPCLGWC